MADLRKMSDDELEALVATGNEAADILEERERAATRARRALLPLTVSDVMTLSGAFVLTEWNAILRAEYYGIPLCDILAAEPIPPGMMATLENAREMLARWDAYLDKERVA